MPLLIDQKLVSDDRWIRITDSEQLDQQTAEADLLVDWGVYVDHSDSLVARAGRLGVAIPNDLDTAELVAIAAKFELIAVDFPSFADGRAFSQAQQLRRFGFSGQIRAQGDVTWDRLRFMHRCGIDAMEVAEDRFTPEMTTAFSEIGVRTQGAQDDPNPTYRQH